MAFHVNIPSDIVAEMHGHHTATVRKAAAVHAAHVAALARLDDPPPGVAPLTAKQRFDALGALRKESLGKIPTPADIATARVALDDLETALDARALAASARFRPMMSDNAESTAGDLRILAEASLRNDYRARVSNASEAEALAEATRIRRGMVGDLRASDVLARLHEFDRATAGRSGPEWSKVRAEVSAAYEAADAWPLRRELVGKISEARKAVNAVEDFGWSIEAPPGSPLGAGAKVWQLAQAA
jgi:hypothetical protein